MTPRTTQTNGNDIAKLSTEMAVIGEQIKTIQLAVDDIKKKLEDTVATKEWVNSKCTKYDSTSTNLNWIIATFCGAIIIAFATFMIKGGLIK